MPIIWEADILSTSCGNQFLHALSSLWLDMVIFSDVLTLWMFPVCEKVESKGRTTYNEVGSFLKSKLL